MSQNESKPKARILERELALVKVEAEGSLQDQALGVVGQWSGRLLELGATHFTAEISGDPDKVTRFISALTPLGLSASFRTGAVTVV